MGLLPESRGFVTETLPLTGTAEFETLTEGVFATFTLAVLLTETVPCTGNGVFEIDTGIGMVAAACFSPNGIIATDSRAMASIPHSILAIFFTMFSSNLVIVSLLALVEHTPPDS
jgi:hypothetical protein